MNKKNIIVSGCSFSEYTYGHPYYTWSNFFLDEFKNLYTIFNEAKDSQGQGIISQKVVNRIIELNFDVELVIVQWSAISRGFANNQREFINKIIEDKSYTDLMPYSFEYFGGMDEGSPSNYLDHLDDVYYLYSLSQIVQLISFLKHHKINYKMFWGWKQISDKIEDKFKKYFQIIYDENFWLFEKNGGIKEYGVHFLGEDGILKDDFHPPTQSQKLFYDKIVKEWIINGK